MREEKRRVGNGISEAKRENLLQRGKGREQKRAYEIRRKSSMQLKKAEVASDLT